MSHPIQRRSLRKQVATHLFDMILNRELLPGDRVVEARIARQLGIAQNTLREGLLHLEHQGLVVKYDGRGTYVTKYTLRQIEDIYGVRLQLEPAAAVLAHYKLESEHSIQLDKSLEKMQEAGEQRNFLELSKADLAFHQLVWRLSGNEALVKALSAISIPLFAFYAIRLYSGAAYDLRKLYEEHRSLLAVLKEGGAEEIEKGFKERLGTFRMQHVQTMKALEFESELSRAHAEEFAGREIN